jgi:type IV fimbrial biogenesis protein FimT
MANGTSRRRGAGYGLIELLIALAIAAILFRLAAPAYGNWIARLEQQNAAHAVYEMLHVARSEAIRRGVRVNACQSGDGVHCAGSGGWEAGWLLYAEEDGDGEREPAESLIQVQGASKSGITIRGNKPVAEYVSYTGLGHTRMLSGALQMGTFTVCRSGQAAIDVVLANGGRARIDETKVPCP